MQANGPDENVSCNILHRLIGQWELLGGEMCRVLSHSFVAGRCHCCSPVDDQSE